MKTKRFNAAQFELDFDALPKPSGFQLGEVVELRGRKFRVHALRPKLLVLWRCPSGEMTEQDVPF